MLTSVQIMYVFTVMQGEANSTNTTPDPWSPLSWIAAIGSLATAAGFGVLIFQSYLTRKQISQTQQEIDTTLRPWLSHIKYTLHPTIPDPKGQRKSFTRLELKNYGRLPARMTKQVQLWKLTEIREEDLAKQPEEEAAHIMIFPDQVRTHERVGEELSITDETNEIYFGCLLWYDFHVGEGRWEGKYWFILKRAYTKDGFDDSILNTLAR